MKKIFSKTKNWIQNISKFVERENLNSVINILLIIGVFVLILSIGVFFLEANIQEHSSLKDTSIKNLVDLIWWIIVTVTTVGYGDKFPQTIPGRFLAVFVIFYGTTLISVIHAVFVNFILNNKMEKEQGLLSYDKFEGHIILCEWNYRSKQILQKLRSRKITQKTPIILIADIESKPIIFDTDKKPIKDNNLFFVKGPVNDETLHQANLNKAKTAIILGDDSLDYVSRDAKVVLSTLTIETINRNVYTIVELVNEEYFWMCKQAYADEIIITSNLSSHLIAHSTIDYGISKVISNMLNDFYDANQIYKIPVSEEDVDHDFIDVFIDMKRNKKRIIIAIQQGDEGKVISNPESDYKLAADDFLIFIAEDKD